MHCFSFRLVYQICFVFREFVFPYRLVFHLSLSPFFCCGFLVFWSRFYAFFVSFLLFFLLLFFISRFLFSISFFDVFLRFFCTLLFILFVAFFSLFYLPRVSKLYLRPSGQWLHLCLSGVSCRFLLNRSSKLPDR